MGWLQPYLKVSECNQQLQHEPELAQCIMHKQPLYQWQQLKVQLKEQLKVQLKDQLKWQSKQGVAAAANLQPQQVLPQLQQQELLS